MKTISSFVLIFTFFAFLSFCSKSNIKGEEETTFTVKKTTLVHTIETNGSIQSLQLLNIQAPLSGRLEKLFVEEGDWVKRGQKLAEMSSDERAQLLDMAFSQGPEEITFWKKQLLPTMIFSPSEGKIIEIKNKPPDNVRGTFMTLSKGEVVVSNLDEVDLPKIKLNQEVYVQLDISPEIILPGILKKISQISKKVNNVNVYEIQVGLSKTTSNDKQYFNRIGMSVTVQIPFNRIENALFLPIEAVSGKSNTRISLLKSNHTTVNVSLGDIYQDSIHILEGLEEGDQILVKKFSVQSGEKSLKTPLNFLKK